MYIYIVYVGMTQGKDALHNTQNLRCTHDKANTQIPLKRRGMLYTDLLAPRPAVERMLPQKYNCPRSDRATENCVLSTVSVLSREVCSTVEELSFVSRA